jgi:TRAP-type C4-dicarboxylate transport system permease small subunit
MDATGCWVAEGARESPLDAVPREPIAALSLGGMVLITLAIVFVMVDRLRRPASGDRRGFE